MVASLVYLNRLDDAKKLMSEFEKEDTDLKNCEYYETLQDLLSEAEKDALSKAP